MKARPPIITPREGKLSMRMPTKATTTAITVRARPKT